MAAGRAGRARRRGCRRRAGAGSVVTRGDGTGGTGARRRSSPWPRSAAADHRGSPIGATRMGDRPPAAAGHCPGAVARRPGRPASRPTAQGLSGARRRRGGRRPRVVRRGAPVRGPGRGPGRDGFPSRATGDRCAGSRGPGWSPAGRSGPGVVEWSGVGGERCGAASSVRSVAWSVAGGVAPPRAAGVRPAGTRGPGRGRSLRAGDRPVASGGGRRGRGGQPRRRSAGTRAVPGPPRRRTRERCPAR
ncbi:hypothetical protein SGLAM104S_09781 [Streptomyces glaucescens]